MGGAPTACSPVWGPEGFDARPGGIFNPIERYGPFVDREGVVKADQPFRRAEAKSELEGIHLSVVISGGALDGTKLEALDTLNTLALW